jgi:hypothetical protein
VYQVQQEPQVLRASQEPQVLKALQELLARKVPKALLVPQVSILMLSAIVLILTEPLQVVQSLYLIVVMFQVRLLVYYYPTLLIQY